MQIKYMLSRPSFVETGEIPHCRSVAELLYMVHLVLSPKDRKTRLEIAMKLIQDDASMDVWTNDEVCNYYLSVVEE
jgi:hypothetical protein